MPRTGPCVCPTCPLTHRDRSLGQWTYVPRLFKAQHPELNLPSDACVNKRADCLEWCGLKQEVPVGRPASKKAKLNEPAVAIAVKEADSLPYPRKIKSIDEIWGVRCAAGRGEPSPADCLPPCLTVLACVRAGLPPSRICRPCSAAISSPLTR